MSDEDDEEDDVISVAEDKYKPASLEKMITLIAMLVEKSRGEDRQLHLSSNDLGTIAQGKVMISMLKLQLQMLLELSKVL